MDRRDLGNAERVETEMTQQQLATVDSCFEEGQYDSGIFVLDQLRSPAHKPSVYAFKSPCSPLKLVPAHTFDNFSTFLSTRLPTMQRKKLSMIPPPPLANLQSNKSRL